MQGVEARAERRGILRKKEGKTKERARVAQHPAPGLRGSDAGELRGRGRGRLCSSSSHIWFYRYSLLCLTFRVRGNGFWERGVRATAGCLVVFLPPLLPLLEVQGVPLYVLF